MLGNLKVNCIRILKAVKEHLIILHGKYRARGIYDSKYLTGKWFERDGRKITTGWYWVIRDSKAGKRLGINEDTPWPVCPFSRVTGAYNISFHPDDLNNFQNTGCYFQGIGKITIGRGTYIAANVGIITANHSIDNLDEHDEPKPVAIGNRCWIGMNSVILPGVTLGEHTIVGAGSVVTKSFTDGDCVIAGNPARELRKLNSLKEETENGSGSVQKREGVEVL